MPTREGWSLLIPRAEEWTRDAACIGMDTDVFFPPRGTNQETIAEAKAVCFGCPVRRECLDYAMRNRERDGIWGGRTMKQRRTLRKIQAAGETES